MTDSDDNSLGEILRPARPALAGGLARRLSVALVMVPFGRPSPYTGRYRVLKKLGEGGMGAVFQAHDPQLGRDVAIKVLHRRTPEPQEDALMREARTLAQLNHPNVLAIYDVGTTDGQMWLAMELVKGGTLRGWAERDGTTWEEILIKMLEAGRGLEVAHREFIVHRDFKPENVLVGTDGRVRVADFGLAATAPEGVAPRRSGSLGGTPRYLAPEVRQGFEATAASDQFAFCVTFRELLDTLDDIPTHCVADIDHAVTRGTADKPEARWPSMSELLHELGRLCGRASTPSDGVFGRDRELEELDSAMALTRQGGCNVAFISGEAGTGKSTLAHTFLQGLDSDCRIATGHCVRLGGGGEAYRPFLDALGGLLIEEPELIELMAERAPSWRPHLRGSSAPQFVEVTPARMQREMIHLLEAVGTNRPLVVALEDMHWSDVSSVDLLAQLAGRSSIASILVIATVRVGDAVRTNHPILTVMRDAIGKRGGHRIVVSPLDTCATEALLRHRLDGAPPPAKISQALATHTNGNALFLVTLIDALLDRGDLTREGGTWALSTSWADLFGDTPSTVSEVVRGQLAALETRQREVLAAGSVVGSSFTCEAISAVLGISTESVESCCVSLAAGRGFVRAHGAEHWPDGTLTSRFEFVHDVVAKAIYDDLPQARRADWHRRIACRLAIGFKGELQRVATIVAVHFEQSFEPCRAAEYLLIAAEQAMARGAHVESIASLSHGLGLLHEDVAGHGSIKLSLLLALGRSLSASRGFGSPEVIANFETAQHLAERLEDERLPSVLYGLANACFYHVDSAGVVELCGRLKQESNAFRALGARLLLGSRVSNGLFEAADRELALLRGELQSAVSIRGLDPFETEAACLLYASWLYWLRGAPEAAKTSVDRAVALSKSLDNPYNLAAVHAHEALGGCFERDGTIMHRAASACLRISEIHDYVAGVAIGEIVLGWLAVMQGQSEYGLRRVQSGIGLWRSTGARLGLSLYLTLQAEAEIHAGQLEAAQATLAEVEAFVNDTGERWLDPEIVRLRGRLHEHTSPEVAMAWYARAVGLAVRAGSHLLGLRALEAVSQLVDDHSGLAIPSDVRDGLRALRVAAEGEAEPSFFERARALESRLGATQDHQVRENQPE